MACMKFQGAIMSQVGEKALGTDSSPKALDQRKHLGIQEPGRGVMGKGV